MRDINHLAKLLLRKWKLNERVYDCKDWVHFSFLPEPYYRRGLLFFKIRVNSHPFLSEIAYNLEFPEELGKPEKKNYYADATSYTVEFIFEEVILTMYQSFPTRLIPLSPIICCLKRRYEQDEDEAPNEEKQPKDE